MKEFIEKLIKELEAGIFSKDEIRKLNSSAQENIICQNKGIKYAIRKVNELAEEHKSRWIPVSERFPDNDSYVLISFANYSMADIGRYEEDEEGGAFYPGDEEASYASFGFVVNAWQPLPELYKDPE